MGPIFVSRSGQTGSYRDELPSMLKDRLLSLRAYDENALIVDAEVAEGEEVLRLIERFFANPQVAQITPISPGVAALLPGSSAVEVNS